LTELWRQLGKFFCPASDELGTDYMDEAHQEGLFSDFTESRCARAICASGTQQPEQMSLGRQCSVRHLRLGGNRSEGEKTCLCGRVGSELEFRADGGRDAPGPRSGLRARGAQRQLEALECDQMGREDAVELVVEKIVEGAPRNARAADMPATESEA
jgi:hypothetical protein